VSRVLVVHRNRVSGVKRIVVIGDPRHLPATVIDQGCQAAGYTESFLSQLLELARKGASIEYAVQNGSDYSPLLEQVFLWQVFL
jgi:hypothetical protein